MERRIYNGSDQAYEAIYKRGKQKVQKIDVKYAIFWPFDILIVQNNENIVKPNMAIDKSFAEKPVSNPINIRNDNNTGYSGVHAEQGCSCSGSDPMYSPFP